MKPVEQIRRENLEFLIREAGTASRLAVLASVPQPYISQVRRAVPHSNGSPRVMGHDVARRLEAAMNKPRGWMDAEHHQSSESDMTVREGQLIALFRLLADSEQVQLVKQLTDKLRRPPDDLPSRH